MFGKTRCLWGRGAVTTRRLLAGSDRPGVIFVRRLGLERVPSSNQTWLWVNYNISLT